MLLYISVIAFSSMLIYGCATTKTDSGKRPEIIFMESHYEKWHGGAPGSKSGTDFYINVIVNTNHSIYFDSIWAENRAQKIKLIKNKELLHDQSSISKGDTLMLRATFLNRDSTSEQAKPIVQINENQALIKVITNDKIKYLVTKELIEKKGPLRP